MSSNAIFLSQTFFSSYLKVLFKHNYLCRSLLWSLVRDDASFTGLNFPFLSIYWPLYKALCPPYVGFMLPYLSIWSPKYRVEYISSSGYFAFSSWQIYCQLWGSKWLSSSQILSIVPLLMFMNLVLLTPYRFNLTSFFFVLSAIIYYRDLLRVNVLFKEIFCIYIENEFQ
jgi:hypothetical protein